MNIGKSSASALRVAMGVLGALAVGIAQAVTPFGATSPARWTPDERAVLDSLHLRRLPPAPRDPSNAVEGSAAAIELGRRLFFDTRLSRDASVACASCHDPQRQFQDGRAVARGIGTGMRRTMPIVGVGHGPWLFWDGRKDSVWSQALGPLEDAAEHGGNRLQLVRVVAEHHSQGYAAAFGPLPDLSGLPRHAGPLGSDAEKAAWASMDPASRDAVSRVFANMGKAIAAYEKTLQHRESRLDRYIDAVLGRRAAGTDALDAQEARGLRLFIGKGQCVDCHNGPLLTDQHFHNTGVAPRDASRPDRGRAAVLAKVAQDEFSCLGRFSDAKPEQCDELRFMATDEKPMEGAFKTPGLRDVALRAPYMHAGQVATLEDVVRHYVKAPHAVVGRSELGHAHDGSASTGRSHRERPPIELTPAEQDDLVAFLKALSAAPPAPAPSRRP